MKALFIGGTGLISTAVSALALEKGWELTLFNRGKHINDVPAGANIVTIDINDEEAVKKEMEGKFYDVIVEWIAFKPIRVERDIELFRGKCAQYILISSSAAYERPQRSVYITESTSLNNRFWQYGCDKRQCEEVALKAYRDEEFPVTIVRPCLTYGNTQIPYAVGSWGHPWSLIKRIMDGKEVVALGDGTSLWTMTHNTDFAKGFVGLMGNRMAIGEAFHITSDETLTWDEVLNTIGQVVGKQPKMVHVSAYQIARFMPEMYGDLIGDKCTSALFDNTKIKRFVPGYQATVPFVEGVRRAYEYFLAHPELQTIDEEWDKNIEAILEADRAFYPKK